MAVPTYMILPKCRSAVGLLIDATLRHSNPPSFVTHESFICSIAALIHGVLKLCLQGFIKDNEIEKTPTFWSGNPGNNYCFALVQPRLDG